MCVVAGLVSREKASRSVGRMPSAFKTLTAKLIQTHAIHSVNTRASHPRYNIAAHIRETDRVEKLTDNNVCGGNGEFSTEHWVKFAACAYSLELH